MLSGGHRVRRAEDPRDADPRGGNLDFCIAIRTITIRDGVARVQAGAGIVADSNPAAEYEETRDKARALLQAIEMAETEL